jgi:hypothetical protein
MLDKLQDKRIIIAQSTTSFSKTASHSISLSPVRYKGTE